MKTPAALAPVLVLALASTGCVDHELRVETEPKDALVTVDGHDLARPEKDGPAVLRFEHYGIRRVVVRKEGFRARDQLVTLDPPWYQLFPLDFVTDVLVPWTITDATTIRVELVQRSDLDAKGSDALLERARATATEAGTEKHP